MRRAMSIPSRPPAFRLPDFRNQGVWLRLLLGANGLLLMGALIRNNAWGDLPREVIELAALIEPALLLWLVLLFIVSPQLQRLSALPGALLVVGLAMGTMAVAGFMMALGFGVPAGWRAPLVAAAGAATVLLWFDLWARAHVPALAEARIAALNARIRPHFLFNSLNAVLGVMREDPRRAEATLEELAELFRALMRDNRELVPLSEEIALARKYLDIERLRLGDRLQVCWEVADSLPETLVPPLLLQPLIENAVYHGIEPSTAPAQVRLQLSATRDGVRIEIENPLPELAEQRSGNHMALENLRERLMLFYDLEARLDTGIDAGRYRVRIDLPTRRAS